MRRFFGTVADQLPTVMMSLLGDTPDNVLFIC